MNFFLIFTKDRLLERASDFNDTFNWTGEKIFENRKSFLSTGCSRRRINRLKPSYGLAFKERKRSVWNPDASRWADVIYQATSFLILFYLLDLYDNLTSAQEFDDNSFYILMWKVELYRVSLRWGVQCFYLTAITVKIKIWVIKI